VLQTAGQVGFAGSVTLRRLDSIRLTSKSRCCLRGSDLGHGVNEIVAALPRGSQPTAHSSDRSDSLVLIQIKQVIDEPIWVRCGAIWSSVTSTAMSRVQLPGRPG
jgi:hypothetical protein